MVKAALNSIWKWFSCLDRWKVIAGPLTIFLVSCILAFTHNRWVGTSIAILFSFLCTLIILKVWKILKERNEYRNLSLFDSLTGLSSLQHTLSFGQTLLTKGHKVRVILIDLDHFKQINDTYGHMTGNKVIVHFASQLRKMMVGINGLVGRLGGDEFVLVMEDSDSTTNLLPIIDTFLNHSSYSLNGEQSTIELSFSIGETVSDRSSITDMEQLMHEADLNMYEYKNRTRLTMMNVQSEQLIEQTSEPILTFDRRGKMLELNLAARTLLGYTNESIKGVSIFKLVADEDRVQVKKVFTASISDGILCNQELRIISNSGAIISVMIIIIPILIGQRIVGYCAISNNKTRSVRRHSRTSSELTMGVS